MSVFYCFRVPIGNGGRELTGSLPPPPVAYQNQDSYYKFWYYTKISSKSYQKLTKILMKSAVFLLEAYREKPEAYHEKPEAHREKH